MLYLVFVAHCTCCKLHTMQIVRVSNCKCCKLHVLQNSSFVNYMFWKLHVLHIAPDANCICYKLHLFQNAHVANFTCWKSHVLQNAHVTYYIYCKVAKCRDAKVQRCKVAPRCRVAKVQSGAKVQRCNFKLGYVPTDPQRTGGLLELLLQLKTWAQREDLAHLLELGDSYLISHHTMRLCDCVTIIRPYHTIILWLFDHTETIPHNSIMTVWPYWDHTTQ